jgi:signal transduction histidine kinase
VLLSAYGLLMICLVAVPVLIATRAEPSGFLNIVAALAVYTGVAFAVRRGHVLPAAIVFNLMNALGPAAAMFTSTSLGTPFYLIFILLLAAITLPPGGVAVAGASIAPLLLARYVIFRANPALTQELLSATLVLLLTGVSALIFSLTSASSIRRLKGALSELVELNATLEERVRARTAELAIAEQRRRDTMKGVGHDMGNLLMLMSGSLGMALETLERQDAARALRLLESFEATTLQLSHVAADLVDSALAETGQLTLQPSAFDLAAATQVVLLELDASISVGTLSVAIESSLDRPALVDPDRIRRVMYNIIGNAVKFTPAGGQIAIQIRGEGEHAVWSCQDTGRGVEPEQLRLLGQELARFEPGTHQGMGLGLYTSNQIVRASGGRITYHSPGRGAGLTVTLTLPLDGAGSASLSPAPPAARLA